MLLSFSAGSAVAQTAAAPSAKPGTLKPNLPPKKLIEYGWDTVPDPAVLRDNIREMEKRPFDGVIFRLKDNVDQVFNASVPWDESKAAPQLKVLSDIKWNKFTDNFLSIYAASNMDWFSDADWKTITDRTRFCALAAKTAKAKGIMFDPEPYGQNPWSYKEQKYASTKSFDEYALMVRKRGAQFMRSMNSEIPALKLLMFYQFSMPYYYSGFDGNPVNREASTNSSAYGLMIPFIDGMLEAAGPQVRLIDGNEFSYYYTTPLEYYRAYYIMRETSKIYAAPELHDKFDQQVRAAQALYVDYNFNLRPDMFPNNPAVVMTPEERALWFETNVYNALQSTDEYVWLYSEKMDWWANRNLPPGMEAAVISAKQKVESHAALGFDVSGTIQAAQARVTDTINQKLLRKTAHIAPVPKGLTPNINGKLDDALYTKTAPLDTFVSLISKGEPTASTKAWVTYDAQNLYVAFDCKEPQMAKLTSTGTTHDSAVWSGDSVEISFQPDTKVPSYYHFILDPKGIQWDGRDKGDKVANGDSIDTSFNPKWKSAVSRQADGWTVEAAIPWSELKMTAPTRGMLFNANLARMRTPESEQTSWSQFVGNFREIQNLGSWIID